VPDDKGSRTAVGAAGISVSNVSRGSSSLQMRNVQIISSLWAPGGKRVFRVTIGPAQRQRCRPFLRRPSSGQHTELGRPRGTITRPAGSGSGDGRCDVAPRAISASLPRTILQIARWSWACCRSGCSSPLVCAQSASTLFRSGWLSRPASPRGAEREAPPASATALRCRGGIAYPSCFGAEA